MKGSMLGTMQLIHVTMVTSLLERVYESVSTMDTGQARHQSARRVSRINTAVCIEIS